MTKRTEFQQRIAEQFVHTPFGAKEVHYNDDGTVEFRRPYWEWQGKQEEEFGRLVVKLLDEHLIAARLVRVEVRYLDWPKDSYLSATVKPWEG
jgi:hypothetical protein